MACSGVGHSNSASQYGSSNPSAERRGSRGEGGGGGNAVSDSGDIQDSPTGNSGDIDGATPTAQSQPAASGGSNDQVSQAIENIKNSSFAQTDKGREVVAKLEEMNRNGDISIQELGGNTAGLAGDGTLRLDDELFASPGSNTTLEGVMVHEAGHELQADHGLAVDHSAGPYSPDALQDAYLATV